MKGLNLSKFHKISSNDKTTTLQHPEGHQIIIAHGSLSHKLKGQLDQLPYAAGSGVEDPQDEKALKMSHGGEMRQSNPKLEESKKLPHYDNGGAISSDPHSPYFDTKEAAKFQKGLNESGGTHTQEWLENIKNGMNPEPKPSPSPSSSPKKYADGTPDQPVSDNDQIQTSQAAPQQQPTVVINTGAAPQQPNPQPSQEPGETLAHKAGNVVKQSISDATGAFSDVARPVAKGVGDFVRGITGKPSQDQEAAHPQGPTQGPPNPPVSSGQQSQQDQSQQQQPDPSQSFGGVMNTGYQNQLNALAQQQGSQKALADVKQGVYGQQLAMDTNQASQDAEMRENLQQNAIKEYQNTMSDLKTGHIDPDKYLRDMGAGEKIKTAIGLLLGGMSTQAGAVNPVWDFLNKQIDRNIAGQEQNQKNNISILQHNINQFQNARDAALMTKLQYNAMYEHMLDQQVNQQGIANPAIQAAYLDAKGKLQQQNALWVSQMGQGIPGGSNNGGSNSDQQTQNFLNTMRMVNPERAKEIESRYVGGVGMAAIPVTPEVRDRLIAHQKLHDAAEDLRQWTKTHTTVLPNTADYNVGAQKALNLQQMVRGGQLQTVYREGEQPLLDKMVNGNPGNLLKNFNTMPKLQEMLNSNEMQLGTLKKAYGLPSQQQKPQQSQGYVPKSFKPASQ